MVAATATSLPVHATGLALGVQASTLGLGVDLTTAFTSFLNGRAGLNYYTYSETRTESNVRYDADLKLQSVASHAGLASLCGRFPDYGRRTDQRQPARYDGPTSFTIGNSTCSPAQVGTLTGKVDFDDVAPYLGIGWGNAVADIAYRV